MVKLLIVIGLVGGLITASMADETKSEPKTKLEAFAGNVGVVSIKGYVEVGTLKGPSPLTVTAMMFRDAKTEKETSGVSVEIAEFRAYGSPNRGRSYIDSDEIPDLLAGLDYISKADATVTPLHFYEVQYVTRGGFKAVVFNNAQGKRSISVSVGRFGNQSAFFSIDELPKFQSLIIRAKEILENPAQIAQKIPTEKSDKQNTVEVASPPSPKRRPSSSSIPPGPPLNLSE